jgi:uncharacterized protein YjbI with pentapeptide repeats
MGAKIRSFWQKNRVAIEVGTIVFVAVVAIIIIGYQFDWTGFGGYYKVTITHIINGTNAGTVTRIEEYQPGKTLWDWLGLLAVLAIPVVVGFGAAWFNSMQSEVEANRAAQQAKESEANREKRHQTDLEIAEKNRERDQETAIKIAADNQHEAAFRAYIDKMSELLTEKRLAHSAPDDRVRNIARLQTLVVLIGLDGIRKRSVLQFLQESGLIEGGKRIIDLSEADLSKANLSEADLGSVDLFNVNLSEADLSNTYLSGAILSEANLSKANLYRADLSATRLVRANLKGANLGRARIANGILSEANLSGANFSSAELFNANLHKALLFASDFSFANLSGADLSYVHQPVDLNKDPSKRTRISFAGAILIGAKFIRARLKEVNFTGADLTGADLSEADLTGADFISADFTGAKITAEQLHTAKSLERATMPDGSIHP